MAIVTLDPAAVPFSALEVGEDEQTVIAALAAADPRPIDELRFELVQVDLADIGAGPDKPAWMFLSGDEDDTDDDQYTEQLAAAYRHNPGQVPPVILNAAGLLVDGFHRRAAARLAGQQSIRAWRLLAAA